MKMPMLMRHLSAASLPYHDPLASIDFNSLHDETLWWLPPPLLSLYGHPDFEQLTEKQSYLLSRYEFMHFLQAGLWVEGLLMQRIAENLSNAEHDELYRYRLHELREEAGHSLMFLQALQTINLPLVSSPFRRKRFAHWLGQQAPFNSALFWLAVWLGEELSDRFNRAIHQSKFELCPAVRQIAKIHMMDEARHMAAAKSFTEYRLQDMQMPQRLFLQWVMKSVLKEFLQVFFYPPAAVYAHSGLTSPERWRQKALENNSRKQWIMDSLRPVQKHLAEFGVAVDKICVK
jgi:hypothetical protein